jgi:hypothetical protein
VDVAVAGQSEIPTLTAAAGIYRAVRVRGVRRAQDRGRGARAVQAGAAQESTPGDVRRRQLAVRHGQIQSRRYVCSGGMCVVVLVRVAVAHECRS